MRSGHEVYLVAMHFKVIYVVLIGFVVEDVVGAKDKFHIKIHVPEVVNHHHHTKFVFEDDKPQSFKEPSVEFDFGKSSPYNYAPQEDGYHKSWKTLRTEKYETETVDNPHSDHPANRYLVKEKYKVQEKLPYIDTPIEYDHEYEYPIAGSDFDYHKSEKLIDSNNEKTDPFTKEFENVRIDVPSFGDRYEVPKKKQKQKLKKSKPKGKNYYYQFPLSDYEYEKSVKQVDTYLKNKPDLAGPLQSKPKKSDDYGYNEVGYDLSPEYEKHKIADLGPSGEDSYSKYKTDGPSYGYF